MDNWPRTWHYCTLFFFSIYSKKPKTFFGKRQFNHLSKISQKLWLYLFYLLQCKQLKRKMSILNSLDYFMCVLPVCMYAPHVCVVSTEVRRGCWMPWSQSYRQQWTMWMLGTRSHNHRANSVMTMNIVQGFALTAPTIFCLPESTHNSSTESILTEKWTDWPLVQPLKAYYYQVLGKTATPH